jgi:hypothetical protein
MPCRQVVRVTGVSVYNLGRGVPGIDRAPAQPPTVSRRAFCRSAPLIPCRGSSAAYGLDNLVRDTHDERMVWRGQERCN